MVDSRQKGARAETAVKNKLKELTNLNWQRVPMSGALNSKHGLKGDLYVPNQKNKYCIEVKHYKDDHLTSKLLTAKVPQISAWWAQTVREANEVGLEPLLIFKHDRSKIFVAFQTEEFVEGYRHLFYSEDCIYIALLEDWIKVEQPEFIG